MDSTSLLLLTFNCAKTKQPVEVVRDAFKYALSKTKKPQIVVVGLEEVMPIMDGCFELWHDYIEPIEQGVEQALGNQYKQCTKTVIGAVVLLTYTDVQLKVMKQSTARVRCGLYLSGLKGGAGARLTIKDEDGALQEFTFVNAHLAANEGMAATRNRDFHTIATGLDFGDGYGLYKPDSHLFFMGDLNYRATLNARSSEELLSDADGLNSSPLDKDELSREIKDQKVFYGFDEGEITFKPTYKYLIGSEDGYKENRTPSWCDRILYLSYGGKEVIGDYGSIQSVVTSDHKPLYLGISVPKEGPKSVFERNGALKRELSGDKSLRYDTNYQWWDSAGQKIDLLIGWVLYLSTSAKGRGILAAILVLLLMVLYWL